MFRLLAAIAAFAVAGCSTTDLLRLALQERQYAEDRLLEAQIRGELAADPALAGSAIEVDVFLKQVRLRGSADPQQFARAHAIAAAVPLVEQVALGAAPQLARGDDDD
jgi:osmotically-inducible protein OsmY